MNIYEVEFGVRGDLSVPVTSLTIQAYSVRVAITKALHHYKKLGYRGECIRSVVYRGTRAA